MDCLEFRKNLAHLVGRQLPESLEREARLHRERCSCCERRARAEERFQSMLTQRLAPRAAPEGLRERVCASLAREELAGGSHGMRLRLFRPAMAILFLLMAVAALGFFRIFPAHGAEPSPLHVGGRLICMTCERAGIDLPAQRRCSSSGHLTGLKTWDGRILSLEGAPAAELRRNSSVRGREVEMDGMLDPSTGAIDIRSYTLR
jgi:hypothetical protein